MDLYALPPEEFTAARDAAVRAAMAAGDKDRAKELAALRRPTASAHAVNALVRAEPDLLTQLLDLGQALGQAQRDGAGDELKALGAQRRQLVEAVADQAAAASGRALALAARDEVVSTLEAALADTASAGAVRTGRLVRALSYAGFGEVDLSGAVAPPQAAQDPDELAVARAVKEAEKRSQQAHGALDDAVRVHDRAVRVAETATATVVAADAAVARAEEALRSAEERRREARLGQEKAADELERSASAVDQAQDEAEQARAALDELRRG